MDAEPCETHGLVNSATAAGIKKAFHKLARSNHPDLHRDDAGAEARFKAIGGAHDLLPIGKAGIFVPSRS